MQDQPDIPTMLQVLRRQLWIILISVLVAVLAAQLVTNAQQPRYEATSTLLVTGNVPSGSDEESDDPTAAIQLATLAQNSSTSLAQLAQTRAVAATAARQLDLPLSAAEGHISGEAEPGVQIVRVRADSDNAQGAARLANAAATALTEAFPGSAGEGLGGLRLELVDPAAPPGSPVAPNRLLNLLLGAGAGLLIGLGLATLRERLDRRIRSSADVGAALGLPVLGELPPIKRNMRGMSAVDRHAIPRIGDPYRSLAASIVVASDREEYRRLLVSSPVQGEGKSTVAAHVALALAQDGETTALVECDLHRPTQHREFPSPERLSLAQQLSGVNGLLPSSAEVRPLLKVLAATGEEPAEGLSVRSPEFERALDAAGGGHQRLLLDAPPILGLSDAAVLARRADAVVLVLRAGRTREADAMNALAVLGRLGMPVLGVVLNGARPGRRGGYYGAQ